MKSDDAIAKQSGLQRSSASGHVLVTLETTPTGRRLALSVRCVQRFEASSLFLELLDAITSLIVSYPSLTHSSFIYDPIACDIPPLFILLTSLRMAQRTRPLPMIEMAKIEKLLLEGETDWTSGDILMPLADMAPDVALADVQAELAKAKDISTGVPPPPPSNCSDSTL